MNKLPSTSFLELVDIESLLKHIVYFEDLSDDELSMLGRGTQLKTFKKNKNLYSYGEKGMHIYVLLDGTIKLGKFSDDNREVIKTILHPRALFGESALASGSMRNSFAKTIENNVRLLEIDVKVFINVMKSNFDFNLKIIKYLGSRLLISEKRIESLVFDDARLRIINFIKDNAKKFGYQVGIDETLLKHSLTQQDIANFIGTSRQTVTSVLNELKKSNKIHFRRNRILIRDIATLD